MQQFTHEEVHIESDIDVRFTIYDSINDYVPEHWHRSMEVVYLYDGKMDMTINHKKYVLTKDDFMIVNTADIHATQTYDYAKVLLLQIPYQFLTHAITDYDNIRFDFTGKNDSSMVTLRNILTSMGQLYTEKPQGYSLRFSSLLYDFLYALIVNYQVTIDHTAKVQSQKNLERFCRFFKRSMGTTFTAYVNSVRLTHVCRDIKNTDLNIGTILEKHGVTNYKLFMRSFKQIYGCTPKDFRKML